MADYISREAAIETLHYYSDVSCASVVSDFEAIPAADVEPVRHGRWSNYELRSDGYRCSYCKNTFRTCQRFCPNCGAEMDIDAAIKEDEDEAAKMAIDALKRQRWIPCSERLPETDGTYLCVTNKVKRTVSTARFYGESDFCNNSGKFLYHIDGHFQTNRYVTHWMPLPEPPEEGGNENA